MNQETLARAANVKIFGLFVKGVLRLFCEVSNIPDDDSKFPNSPYRRRVGPRTSGSGRG